MLAWKKKKRTTLLHIFEHAEFFIALFPFKNVHSPMASSSKTCLLRDEIPTQFEFQIYINENNLSVLAQQNCFISIIFSGCFLALSACLLSRLVHLAVDFMYAGFVMRIWHARGCVFHSQLDSWESSLALTLWALNPVKTLEWKQKGLRKFRWEMSLGL